MPFLYFFFPTRTTFPLGSCRIRWMGTGGKGLTGRLFTYTLSTRLISSVHPCISAVLGSSVVRPSRSVIKGAGMLVTAFTIYDLRAVEIQGWIEDICHVKSASNWSHCVYCPWRPPAHPVIQLGAFPDFLPADLIPVSLYKSQLAWFFFLFFALHIIVHFAHS